MGILKMDFEDLRSSHAAVVAEKVEVDKTKRVKLQRFQDTLRKRLAELRCDTEASMAALGGRCAEFPANPSVSDLLEWLWAEDTMMPTIFAECNKNITCYALIDVFQMLVGEGCEHLPKLKELLLSCDASVLQDFPTEIGWIAKKTYEELMDQRWCVVLYTEDQRREPGELRYILLLVHKCISLSYGLFVHSWEPMNLSRVTMCRWGC
jgi:hypothetical protein